MSGPLLDLFAREHPAFVHVPLGLVIALPFAMAISFKAKHPHPWKLASFFVSGLALMGAVVALASGLYWGRQISLIPAGGYFPAVASQKQVLQRMLQLHEVAALVGVVIGMICLVLLWRTLKQDEDVHHAAPTLRRRLSDRGVGFAPMFFSLLWLASWGFCGKLGGIMVFGNEETNKAAAAAELAKKNDAEADLPIRALDYASLEPALAAPMKSRAHGNHWARIWVTASGIDDYKAGKPLPAGAYAVLSTVEDSHGKPGQEPGPLYMRETLADGRVSFAFYWPRVPESSRAQTSGEEFVYWRSPSEKLQACAACHATAGPATK
ncbi:MAG: hypothetical protein KGN80_00820 [Acidobacteriota bacterium]|nr:hypothetical protein [Acidobacteriota bacterium]